LGQPMSALGQKQTFAVQKGMSALPPKADMCSAPAHVCFVPIATDAPPDFQAILKNDTDQFLCVMGPEYAVLQQTVDSREICRDEAANAQSE
jgi:hypothetical protein